MTRDEAAAFVRDSGAVFSPNVTRRTTLLVIGEEGWPFREDGRLTRKLQTARNLRRNGQEIAILSEAEFLQQFSANDAAADAGVRGTCSLLELTRMLGVRRDAVRAWLRAGLIEPLESRDGMPVFDFRQVSRARNLVALVDGGIPIKTLRRSLQQIRTAIPGVDVAIDCLDRIRLDGTRLILSSETGELCEPSGQRVFDFERSDAPSTIAFDGSIVDDLFDAAVGFEDARDFVAARNAYQRLLETDGPDADVCFNLGNVLYALGERGAACERFRQAVELDLSFADAWANLGSVSAERDRPLDALRAFERVLAIDATSAVARCGLADALEELGRHDEARGQWKAYLRRESEGEWADYARDRLSATA